MFDDLRHACWTGNWKWSNQDPNLFYVIDMYHNIPNIKIPKLEVEIAYINRYNQLETVWVIAKDNEQLRGIIPDSWIESGKITIEDKMEPEQSLKDLLTTGVIAKIGYDYFVVMNGTLNGDIMIAPNRDWYNINDFDHNLINIKNSCIKIKELYRPFYNVNYGALLGCLSDTDEDELEEYLECSSCVNKIYQRKTVYTKQQIAEMIGQEETEFEIES